MGRTTSSIFSSSALGRHPEQQVGLVEEETSTEEEEEEEEEEGAFPDPAISGSCSNSSESSQSRKQACRGGWTG